MMKTVLIAGATGYLGHYLCEEYQRRGWYVTALVRDAQRAKTLVADQLVQAEATKPETLRGIMAGAELVVSALGITRQADGLGYWEVDYQANLNLLREAESSGAQRFAYVHVLNADEMRQVPLVAAKTAFVDALLASDLASTVIAPSGYYSDMGDFLSMARSGWVWLFGDGACQINPIHGADLALAIADAVEARRVWVDVGGPEVMSLNDIAALAFRCLDQPARVTRLPDVFRRLALTLLPWVTPRRVHGPAQFFLTAMGRNMVGACVGTHTLKDHFETEINAATRGADVHRLLPKGETS